MGEAKSKEKVFKHFMVWSKSHKEDLLEFLIAKYLHFDIRL